MRKRRLFCFITCLLLICVVFGSMVFRHVQKNNVLYDFSQYIKKENYDDLKLTLYYLKPDILVEARLDVDDLINNSGKTVKKVIVSGSDLEKYRDLYKRLSKLKLKPIKNKSSMDAQVYYYFEVKQDKILEVVISTDSIFVNGHEVEYNYLFYEVIRQFTYITSDYC